MRDNSVPAMTIGGVIQVAGLFLAGVCALQMLGACSQKLSMLKPATGKLAAYHVKELVVHAEGGGGSESESPEDADRVSSVFKTAIGRELRATLRGTNPANAIIRLKDVADLNTHSWTDESGFVHHVTVSNFDYYVNLTFKDALTHDVIAEQWFLIDRGNWFTRQGVWRSLSRDEQLNRWSSRLAEQIRLWVSSAEPETRP